MRLLLFFAFVVFALLAALAWTKDHGAVEQPVLVTPAAADLPAWRLLPICSIDRRNIPIIREERSA